MSAHILKKVMCLLALVVPLAAQTSDTGILGTVTDATRAAIASATVTLTQPSSGLSRTAKTTADGSYEFRYLIPGEYIVDVVAAGFNQERRTGIVVTIGQLARVELSIQVGAVREVVSVTGASPMLETQTATTGEVVGQERILNLPLNGRRFDDLSVLTPGATVYDPDLHSSSTDGSRISVNGGRDIWLQVNLDGITMVNNRDNYVNIFPSVDAIQEFKVQTGNYSAEYGGSVGANVNIEIKSGTNKFHGDVFEFLRNTALDARNYFAPAPLPQNILKQNQFGATFGGPVRRDKTFFFTSYEGIRSIADGAGSAVVLTPAQRAGNFSSSSTPIIDPLSGSPFPNNIIPASRLDPVSANLINTYTPLPNASGTVNYFGDSVGNLTVHQGIVRVDQYFSERDQLFVHWFVGRRDFPDTDLNSYFKFTGTYPMQNFQAQYIHTFGPTLVNEFRGGFNLEHVQQLSTRYNTNFTAASVLGINGLLVGGPGGRALKPEEEGFPLISIGGYMGMGDDLAASNLDNSRTYQFVDNLTWIKGAHTLKFGGDIRWIADDATTDNWPYGSISFTSDIAGDAAASFMLGFPRTVLSPEGVPITQSRDWRLGFYAQDDWKVTPHFTLNLGLRYDLFLPPHDNIATARTLDFSSGQVPELYPAPGQLLNPVWTVSDKDFSPRIGFAYTPRNNWVVRGGVGNFFFGGQFDNMNILQLNPPNGGSLTVINPTINPIATIENPIPAALYPTGSAAIWNVVTLPAGRYHPDTNVYNWNLQVSHQFGENVLELGYVGNKGTHVDSSLTNWNQPEPGTGDIQSRRPYPEYSRIRMEYFYGNTNYNSLQARFEHRFSKGLSYTAAYTWSHNFDDAAQTMNRGACGCQDPRNLRSEYASSNFDQRHRLVMGYVWELPFAKNLKGPAAALAGGWTLDGLITFASGNPFDVLESFDSQNNGGFWERPSLVSGQRVTVGSPTPSLWFNTAAFTPSVLVYGNSPRNPLVGPGTSTFDLSASKMFHMPYSENHSLQFRVELFNAFNTPQFSNPDSYLGDSTFGQITSTKVDNREIQLALKYVF